jgi:hypothetical protein
LISSTTCRGYAGVGRRFPQRALQDEHHDPRAEQRDHAAVEDVLERDHVAAAQPHDHEHRADQRVGDDPRAEQPRADALPRGAERFEQVEQNGRARDVGDDPVARCREESAKDRGRGAQRDDACEATHAGGRDPDFPPQSFAEREDAAEAEQSAEGEEHVRRREVGLAVGTIAHER